ncbi:Uncharacterized protein CLAVI_000179 [Candidatus Clavichlamydia salmonicola]|uniref:hypothetical protein n=1 Tax=Candidatus Clavichlamydia salmonicola TaxID=469812 RepID=UPI0018914B2D|nr:hypothetical protein [Candidatus Clavichlamydia salmonicola]MBF5050568.1 Uncharacterized protein [Candidatus Clavichlamydia salmonicola]
MSPYVMTLFWLTIMMLVSTGESFQAINNQMRLSLFKQREDFRNEFNQLLEEAKFDRLKKQYGKHLPKNPSSSVINTPVKKPYALRLQTYRPPDEARFNIALVRDSTDKDVKAFYDIFVSLLKRIIAVGWQQSEPTIFVSGIEESIALALVSKRDELLSLSSEEELSSIILDNPQVNCAWLLLLKGREGIPSLLNFIRLTINGKASYKINLLFAEPLLIEAILGHDLIAKELIALRDDFFSRMCFQEEQLYKKELSLSDFKNRTVWRQELTTAIFSHCTDMTMNTLQHYFNFTLGSPGSYIILKDPLTGTIERKRCK